MKLLKGTQTEKNLLTAFAGESQARNRYDYFASQAKKDGYVQISQTFSTIAMQEKEHAERLFKFLEGGELSITDTFPAGQILDTLSNLKSAAAGEKHENSEMYPSFAKIAADEGFEEIAEVLLNIAIAERYHESLFLGFIKNIEEGTVFKRDKVVRWHCRNCGCIVENREAPNLCPACAHAKDYFDVVH